MIIKFNLSHLRNAEYYQFIVSVCEIFAKYDTEDGALSLLYAELREYLRNAETTLAVERKNAKVREKNEADRYRDKLHGKLFNYVKAITYDEKDPCFDDAQTIMRILKDVGNPTKLAENAESAVLTTLGNRLEPYRRQMETVGVQKILDALLEANRQFIALEIECREVTTAQNLRMIPSMSEIRKRADAVYRTIINVINGNSWIPAKGDEYREMIAAINVLATKYDQLLMARKSAAAKAKEKTVETTAK